MTKLSSSIIIGCWTVFIVWWFVSALRTKAVAEKQSLGSMLAHRIPIGLGFWFLAFPKLRSPWVHQVFPHTALLQLIGAAICIYGLLFTIWARRTLAGNWSSDVTFKRNHELIRTGPYRVVRHPIYTGLLLMSLGTALVIGELRALICLVLITIGFWIKLSQEERLLLRHFPEHYPTYQREVKALVPFVI